jgi:hypothetical protein
MSEQERMDGPKLVSDEKLAEFEVMLARAMRPVEAPEGFASRVVVRASANPTHADETVMDGAPGTIADAKVFVMRRRNGLWRMQAWMGGAVAAVLVLGMFGAEQIHQRREQAKADQQFALAVQATDHALDQTREQLQRAGLNLGE